MTKKDYELIASTIKERYDFYTEFGGDTNEQARARTAVSSTAKNLARKLKKENEKFNEKRFIEACGVK
jgi:hypothetical protein